MERERIDDLGINGYQIIQKEQGFCFGMDAVLLSDFAQVKNGGRVQTSVRGLESSQF